MMIDTDVLIVGGGLSGLRLATRLYDADVKFHLVEARRRLGGRIKVLEHEGAAFDLGPSWFWPGQPRLASLADDLKIEIFDQYASGALSYENEQGQVARNQGWASMQGSLRLAGGMAALIEGLVNKLPASAISLGTDISRIIKTAHGVDVFFGDGTLLARAQKVVLCLPPRLATTLDFEPSLPDNALRAAQNVPTWMAGHAKFVAVYDTPFWRAQGLSGDAMSRRGPMIEMHDASDPRFGFGALFGFLGVLPEARQSHRKQVEQACVAQLARLFGAEAAKPCAFHLQDWAFEKQTAIEADHQPPAGHPHYGMPQALSDLWDGSLMFGSTEIATEFGGFLEGALEAGDMTAQRLIAARSSSQG